MVMSEQSTPGVQQTLVGTRGWGIRPARPSDAAFITDQWGQYFGEFDDVPGVIELGVDPDDPYNICMVAVAGDELIGTGIASVGPLEHIVECLQLGRRHEYLADGNGYLHFGSVQPAWRDRGVGTALMESRLRWLQQAGGDRVFGLSWLRDAAPDSAPVFQRCGFRKIEVLEDYYAEHGDRPFCPDCGDACSCDAILFGRDLD